MNFRPVIWNEISQWNILCNVKLDWGCACESFHLADIFYKLTKTCCLRCWLDYKNDCCTFLYSLALIRLWRVYLYANALIYLRRRWKNYWNYSLKMFRLVYYWEDLCFLEKYCFFCNITAQQIIFWLISFWWTKYTRDFSRSCITYCLFHIHKLI